MLGDTRRPGPGSVGSMVNRSVFVSASSLETLAVLMGATSLLVCRGTIAVLLALGLAALVLNAVLAFEEPNNWLLFSAVLFLFSPVVAVFAHVAFSRTLTTSERRTWFGRLASRHCMWALSAYFSCSDLRAGAATLSRARDPHQPR